MKRWLILVTFLLSLLSSATTAELQPLLQWQRKGDPGAYISSGFHDWRGVSKYRRNPGIHAGYDIAMLAGSPVRTPWSGTVVAVTPWYGPEVGVSLKLDNGWEATFGHITAGVHVGDRVQAGQMLGRVVVDHVDVKIRDTRGLHIDFARHEFKLASAKLPAPSLALPKDNFPDAYARYKEVSESVSLLEYKVGLGLAAPVTLKEQKKKLEVLKPLALRHAVANGLKLPSHTPRKESSSQKARPVTEMLLDL